MASLDDESRASCVVSTICQHQSQLWCLLCTQLTQPRRYASRRRRADVSVGLSRKVESCGDYGESESTHNSLRQGSGDVAGACPVGP